MKLSEKHTVAACFTSIMVQAIVINFSPLLFITFEESFGISLGKISTLIAVSFVTQFSMDFLAVQLPRLFNNRFTIVLGQVFAAVGLAGLAIFPLFMPPFIGLLLATVIAAFGSGIIEIMGNPVIESCSVKNKNKIITFFHSGYCWGLVLTVVLSTLFFATVGIKSWRILACLWALVPALNAILFSLVPLNKLRSVPKEKKGERSRFATFTFWAFFVLMLCGGAAEQAMSQWASSFAEMGLGVTKSVGDLLGPCLFAVLMGISRIIYAKYSDVLNLTKFMLFSSVLCVISYLLAALAPDSMPLVSLLGCGLCGFSVGIMWPGTICLATGRLPNGGIKMFALLALAGDVGCTLGPTAVGWIAEGFGNNLKASFIFSAIFPTVIILLMAILSIKDRKGIKKEFKDNGIN